MAYVPFLQIDPFTESLAIEHGLHFADATAFGFVSGRPAQIHTGRKGLSASFMVFGQPNELEAKSMETLKLHGYHVLPASVRLTDAVLNVSIGNSVILKATGEKRMRAILAAIPELLTSLDPSPQSLLCSCGLPGEAVVLKKKGIAIACAGCIERGKSENANSSDPIDPGLDYEGFKTGKKRFAEGSKKQRWFFVFAIGVPFLTLHTVNRFYPEQNLVNKGLILWCVLGVHMAASVFFFHSMKTKNWLGRLLIMGTAKRRIENIAIWTYVLTLPLMTADALAYSAFLWANCHLDHSTPERHIVEARYHPAPDPRYSWFDLKEIETGRIFRQPHGPVFDRAALPLAQGERLQISVKSGVLRAAWMSHVELAK